MEYPLLINGERAGSLSVTREGLYTLMEAWTDKCGELTRVWIHGGGRQQYLGVMQPWSGGLYLKRKLSRRELESFPTVIEFASDDGGDASGELQASSERAEPAPAPVRSESAQPPRRAESGELLWFRREDGSLTAFDGHVSLVALPAKLRRRVPGADLRRIDGVDYMVFHY